MTVSDSTTEARPSGRFVLRLDPDDHARLRAAAKAAALSLNEYCVRKLTSPSVAMGGAAADAVAASSRVCGEHLRAVVVFGSWARGEAAAHSDVDLLIVVAAELAVTRQLYRIWDRKPTSWEGRSLEPHFVHQPATQARPSGLWAEVATDGIVLFDPELEASRYLVRVRGLVNEGRIRRRRVHGQSYWVGEVRHAE